MLHPHDPTLIYDPSSERTWTSAARAASGCTRSTFVCAPPPTNLAATSETTARTTPMEPPSGVRPLDP